MTDIVSTVVTPEEKQVARPLHMLVRLIRENLQQGDEAAQQAGMPHYCAAGEKLLEAKGQLAHGEFIEWVQRNFNVRLTQARMYMKLAAATISKQNSGAPSSLREFERDMLGRNRQRNAVHAQIIGNVDVALNIRRSELKRAEEREAERKLALQLIDIGYKALASKLHPDKGGSPDAMARLNRVRDRLKQHA